jgi:drug/metabolite transporter (DMT)-like permease
MSRTGSWIRDATDPAAGVFNTVMSTFDRRALAAALVTVVFWASGFVAIRATAPVLSPGSIALGRLSVGVVLLTIFMLRQGWRPIARRDLALVIASGLAWYALYFVVLNQAEKIIDAATAAMLVNTGPIFVAVLAGWFLKEGFPARLLIGSGIAFTGSVIIALATRGDPPAGAGDPTIGIILCIVAAFSYASGVTLQKPALRRVPALQLTWTAVAAAFVVTLPFGPTMVSELRATTPDVIGWLVWLGLFPTAIAFTTWSYALSKANAGRLASLTYLVPPIVVLMAWGILGEVPPPLAIAGGALCLGGVIVARTSGGLRLPRRAAPAEGSSS